MEVICNGLFIARLDNQPDQEESGTETPTHGQKQGAGNVDAYRKRFCSGDREDLSGSEHQKPRPAEDEGTATDDGQHRGPIAAGLHA